MLTIFVYISGIQTNKSRDKHRAGEHNRTTSQRKDGTRDRTLFDHATSDVIRIFNVLHFRVLRNSELMVITDVTEKSSEVVFTSKAILPEAISDQNRLND